MTFRALRCQTGLKWYEVCAIKVEGTNRPRAHPQKFPPSRASGFCVGGFGRSGSIFLIIPDDVRLQLGREELTTKEVTLADGSRKVLPYVGPIETSFKNRAAYVGAIVMGDEVVLGAIPMDDMDLVVIPNERRVDINPANPNFAVGYAK